MASSLIENAIQINFDSVLGISNNDGMLNMFKDLEASGLRGFLGCPSTLYERELEQFFDPDIVQEGDITCAISGKYVAISESRFAGVLGLPTEGLTDISAIHKDLVYDARSIFSQSGEPVSFSCKKRLLKYEYRLLNDILAKSLTVKADSFETVTHKRFLMMTVIQFGIKVNWSKILFEVLKEMVDKTIKMAKGFAAQICVLFKGDPAVTLGDAMTFPQLKILSAKTVSTYVDTNKTIDSRGKTVESGVAKVAIVRKKSVSKKKSTPADADDEPVEVVAEKAGSRKRPAITGNAPAVKKKKRTSKGNTAHYKENLELVSAAKEAMPIQKIAPTSAVPAEQPPVPKSRAPKRKFRIPASSDDEIVEKRAAVEEIVTNIGEPDVQRADETENMTDISFAEFAALDFQVFSSVTDRMFETGSESEDEFEMSASKKPSQISESENRVVESASAAYLVEEPIEETEQNQGTEIADAVPTADAKISDDEWMTLEEHLSTIPDGSSLPSTTGEVTKIQFGKSITIRGVDEGDWYKVSLPKIPADDKGKEPLQERDPIKGNPAKETFSLIIEDIELLVQLREKVIDEVDAFLNSFSLKRLAVMKLEEIYAKEERSSDSSSSHALLDIHVDTPVLFTTADAHQGTDTFVDQSLLLSTAPTATAFTDSFAQLRDSISQISIKQKGTRAHHAFVTTELADIRKEVKSMDEHLATVRSEILDFRAQEQENHLNLSTQLGFLVDCINRGGDAKKGEGGSSRPQPPLDDQNRPSGGSGIRGSGGGGDSIRRRGSGGYRERHSSGGSGGGPIKRDAEYWIYGKRQF
ncbi:hypothetical protein F511_33762 [Dorcoceras hygrometricum]|uniref:Dystroglycan-like n=1 Tax=Dorcoceras hygrometricum TaxID=472368 RepID=A0A2Z7DDP4_9LAMI|nr:hypothetical protein F511_33762 [Dorcoceras hygrometricum]